MTVIDASNKLYKWFLEHDTFCLKDNFKKLIILTEDPAKDEAALLAALAEFEKIELVKRVENRSESYFILRKNLLSYDQPISLNANLALAIADVINSFCEVIGDKTDECDPLKISEKDISNLLIIASDYIQKIKSRTNLLTEE